MIKKLSILILATLFSFTIYSQQDEQDQYEGFKEVSLNDKFSNFGTSFYGEKRVIFSCPKRGASIIRNNWEGNGQPFLDLYIGDIAEDGDIKSIKNFSGAINTRYHESNVAVTKDLKTIYFSRNNYLNNRLVQDSTGTSLIQLYRAKKGKNGKWGNIEPMPFNSKEYQTGHPALSHDEKTLYFISDMPGGYGQTDIYKAPIAEDGTIGEPENLGPLVNTQGREMFLTMNGKNELYFSSDGRAGGYGGLDIYAVKIIKGEVTGKPINLGKPINSSEDDLSFIVNYKTKRGYVSSKRTTKGNAEDDNIYTFIQNYPIDFACNQEVKGIVTEAGSNRILPEATVTLYSDTGKELGKTYTNVKGEYKFKIKCNKNYEVVASKQGFEEDRETFFSEEEAELYVPLSLTMEEFEVKQGKCIIKINAIYFDFDRYNIRKDAAIELDKVVKVMQKYPELIIEGGSHTDSRGPDKYNQRLSQNRANSTVKYIIAQGISSDRITARGYGETQLTNDCSNGVRCTEKEHQLNRRTEFVIQNMDEIREKYPDICGLKVDEGGNSKPMIEIKQVE